MDNNGCVMENFLKWLITSNGSFLINKYSQRFFQKKETTKNREKGFFDLRNTSILFRGRTNLSIKSLHTLLYATLVRDIVSTLVKASSLPVKDKWFSGTENEDEVLLALRNRRKIGCQTIINRVYDFGSPICLSFYCNYSIWYMCFKYVNYMKQSLLISYYVS